MTDVPARRCPACDRELVQRPDEKTWQFAMRATCGNRECFREALRMVNQKKWDLVEQEMRADVEQRTEEMRQAKRAAYIAEGCKLTDSLD